MSYAEELSEMDKMELMGLSGGRDLLNFITENEMLSAEQLTDIMSSWMTDEQLYQMLRANELTPEFMFDDDFWEEMKEEF